MDFDLDDLISSDATNNAKVNTKFQPKAKPKPRPKPKTQPGPKSAPTRTQEEQPANNATQISEIINDDRQSFVEKSHENAESFLPLESLNDFLPQSTTLTENPPPCSEATTLHVSVNGNLEKGPIELELSNNMDSCTNLESFAQLDPLTGEEAAIINDNDFQIGDLTGGTMDAESSLFWEPLDILSQSKASSGTRVGKFKPKPKAQTRKTEQTATNEPVPSFTAEEVLGSSSIGVTDSIPTETVYDFHVNEEPINLTEVSQMDSMIPSETPTTGPKSAKKGRRKTQKGLNPTQQDKDSVSSGRLRKRANKTHELIDESENEGIDDEFLPENEDNDNNSLGSGPENESLSEKKGNKSKKPVNEKEKPVRKRKKTGEVPVESTKVAKKKFTHRTRRNKRQVNPDLLKIPEDELDLYTVPMKELIRLAEHKERIAKKEASTLGTPALNQSFSNHYGEDEGTGSAYEHDYSMEAENTTYYNYRTHMKITPRMKWTKQDTELFYEAVQQFGSDLSMIKECFPGRTREQIKSKYKKEERQHPLRLHDALTTRFKGHSHFEVVIERLKQAQAQDSDNDDPINLTGEEDEEVVAANTNDAGDATKAVKLEKEIKEMEPESPTKSNDSEDDMYRWSQYKSEI